MVLCVLQLCLRGGKNTKEEQKKTTRHDMQNWLFFRKISCFFKTHNTRTQKEKRRSTQEEAHKKKHKGQDKDKGGVRSTTQHNPGKKKQGKEKEKEEAMAMRTNGVGGG